MARLCGRAHCQYGRQKFLQSRLPQAQRQIHVRRDFALQRAQTPAARRGVRGNQGGRVVAHRYPRIFRFAQQAVRAAQTSAAVSRRHCAVRRKRAACADQAVRQNDRAHAQSAGRHCVQAGSQAQRSRRGRRGVRKDSRVHGNRRGVAGGVPRRNGYKKNIIEKAFSRENAFFVRNLQSAIERLRCARRNGALLQSCVILCFT